MDDPSDPALPNKGLHQQTGGPPDATLAANSVRKVASTVYNDTVKPPTGLMVAIKTSLGSTFAPSVLNPTIHNVCMGVEGGDQFVSAFMGYHAVWYQAWSAGNMNPACKVGFHTHVGLN